MWESVGSCFKYVLLTWLWLSKKFWHYVFPKNYIWKHFCDQLCSILHSNSCFIVSLFFASFTDQLLHIEFSLYYLNFLSYIFFPAPCITPFFKMSHYMNIFNLSYPPSVHFFYFLPHLLPYFISLPPSLLSDFWLSNKSFSPLEGAWSTLTWSLWPRNTSSFLHMVGSLTEIFTSALAQWGQHLSSCHTLDKFYALQKCYNTMRDSFVFDGVDLIRECVLHKEYQHTS